MSLIFSLLKLTLFRSTWAVFQIMQRSSYLRPWHPEALPRTRCPAAASVRETGLGGRPPCPHWCCTGGKGVPRIPSRGEMPAAQYWEPWCPAPRKCGDREVHPHSLFRLPGPDVDWGARMPQFRGEDVHPHLYLSLEQRWVSWQGFLASVLCADLGSPVPGS